MEKNVSKKRDFIPINNENYYTLHKTAVTLGISERSLRREVARKNIRYLRHPQGLLFHPSWCDEWVSRYTVQPRKTMR